MDKAMPRPGSRAELWSMAVKGGRRNIVRFEDGSYAIIPDEYEQEMLDKTVNDVLLGKIPLLVGMPKE
jgi:hypothetical protein